MSKEHHAKLFYSNSVKTADLKQSLESSEVKDSYLDSFGIDDARELVKQAYNRPVGSEELVFIVRASFITLEAQNSLLKVIEEPPTSTRFIFVLPPDFVVLPTVLSRVEVDSEQDIAGNQESETTFKDFLSQSYKDRLSLIEKSAKAKDVVWQRLVKQGLISYLNKENKSKEFIEELEFVARKLLTRGASNKMLLEHLALIL